MKLFKKKLYRKRLIKKLIWKSDYYLENSLYRCGKYNSCCECTYGDEEAHCKALTIINDIEWIISKMKG